VHAGNEPCIETSVMGTNSASPHLDQEE